MEINHQLTVALATSLTPDLERLWQQALHDVVHKRGGPALLDTMRGRFSQDRLLGHVLGSKSLWTVRSADELQGFAVVRENIIEAVYVASGARRHKVATTLVGTLLAGEHPPLDAYALPGDRGMKSLYESIGWKARLLTMRGA